MDFDPSQIFSIGTGAGGGGLFAWILSKINRKSIEDLEMKVELHTRDVYKNQLEATKVFATKQELRNSIIDLKDENCKRFDKLEAILTRMEDNFSASLAAKADKE